LGNFFSSGFENLIIFRVKAWGISTRTMNHTRFCKQKKLIIRIRG
jgi:hypothetical protein